MDKYASFGAVLKRTTVAIAGIKSIGGIALSTDTADVTSHDSPDGFEEVVATIKRTGEVSLEIVYDPNEATHKNAAGGLLHDWVHRNRTEYTITFPSSPTANWVFDAYVVGFEPGLPVEGSMTAAVKLKPSGAVTLP